MLNKAIFRLGTCLPALAWCATAARALPFDVPIDPNQSVLTFQLCVSGKCDDDSSPVSGTMTIALDCVDFPSQIWLYDFHQYLQRDLQFYLSWGFFGSLTATASGVSLHYAYPGTAMGPVPVAGGAFTFPAVSATKQGTLTYHAIGVPCAALQAGGHPCDDAHNLANDPPSSSDWDGNAGSAARIVALITNVDITQPLDPNNPTLGTMRVYGTVRGSAYVPRPPGDVDGDGDADFLDFDYFADCMAGPDVVAPPPGCSQYHFGGCDLDGDGDADLADCAVLQRVLAG